MLLPLAAPEVDASGAQKAEGHHRPDARVRAGVRGIALRGVPAAPARATGVGRTGTAPPDERRAGAHRIVMLPRGSRAWDCRSRLRSASASASAAAARTRPGRLNSWIAVALVQYQGPWHIHSSSGETRLRHCDAERDIGRRGSAGGEGRAPPGRRRSSPGNTTAREGDTDYAVRRPGTPAGTANLVPGVAFGDILFLPPR